MVNLLLEHGAEINRRPELTPLLHAVSAANFEAVETLIAEGADLNVCYGRQTLLGFVRCAVQQVPGTRFGWITDTANIYLEMANLLRDNGAESYEAISRRSRPDFLEQQLLSNDFHL